MVTTEHDRISNHDGTTTTTTSEITSTTAGARSPDGRFLKTIRNTTTKILRVTTRQLAWTGICMSVVAIIIAIGFMSKVMDVTRIPIVASASATMLSTPTPSRTPTPSPTISTVPAALQSNATLLPVVAAVIPMPPVFIGTMGDPSTRGPLRLAFGSSNGNGTTNVLFYFSGMKTVGRILVYRPDTHVRDAALWISVNNIILDERGVTWGVISLPVRTSGEQLILNYATTYPPQDARDWGQITTSTFYDRNSKGDGLTLVVYPKTMSVTNASMR